LSRRYKDGSQWRARQGRLFRRVDRNGHILDSGLSDNAIWRIVAKRPRRGRLSR
jgi:hypothetical protein